MKKRLLKSIVCIIMITVMLSGNTMQVYATGIMPIMDACDVCYLSFIVHEGVPMIDISYMGKPDTFMWVDVEVKIQQRVLGIFWSTLDIGYDNNVWKDYSYSCEGNFYHEFPEVSAGTYRAVFYVKFTGRGGLVDEIEDTITCEYNG